MGFSPINASKDIVETYKRYLRTIFQFDDDVYEEQFKTELNKDGQLEKGPYLDVVASFQKGRTIEDLIQSGILPHSFSRLHMKKWPLYLHQEEALLKCASGKNIVVSTGTGSGKTESFLLPVLLCKKSALRYEGLIFL